MVPRTVLIAWLVGSLGWAQGGLGQAFRLRNPNLEGKRYSSVRFHAEPYKNGKFAVTELADDKTVEVQVWELQGGHWSWIFQYTRGLAVADDIRTLYLCNGFSDTMRQKLENGRREPLNP